MAAGVVKGLTLSGFTHIMQNPAKPNHFFLQPSVAAANAYAMLFPVRLDSVVTDYIPGATYVAGGAPLQSVIDGASPGDTIRLSQGVYTDLTVNKHLKLIGAGSGSDPASSTIVRRSTGGAAIALSGSGLSDADPILLKNLRVEPMGDYGINLGNAQYVRFEISPS